MPESATDTNYSVVVVTVAANHLKARDIKDIQGEILPGVSTAMGARYTEGVDLTGVPRPLQDIAHNPGNQLSTKRQADFVAGGRGLEAALDRIESGIFLGRGRIR